VISGVGQGDFEIGLGASVRVELIHLGVSNSSYLSDEGCVLGNAFRFPLLVIDLSFCNSLSNLLELIDGYEKSVGIELLGHFDKCLNCGSSFKLLCCL
jgi:hypothetical protein